MSPLRIHSAHVIRPRMDINMAHCMKILSLKSAGAIQAYSESAPATGLDEFDALLLYRLLLMSRFPCFSVLL